MPDRSQTDLDLKAADTLARVMDDYYIDPAMGFLLPGLGDVVSSVAGLLIVALAWRRQLSRPVIARMLMNLAIDAAVGAIPIAGDGFDVFFKAHTRNAALLRQRATQGERRWQDGLILAAAAAAFVAALALPICLAVWLATILYHAVAS